MLCLEQSAGIRERRQGLADKLHGEEAVAMGSTNTPDFANGFAAEDLQNGGMIQGSIGGEDVILARISDEFFAVGAGCTHYHGPLAEGLIVGDELRCPLHHACFSLRTGMALCALSVRALVDTCGAVDDLHATFPKAARRYDKFRIADRPEVGQTGQYKRVHMRINPSDS
jgi:nitrite reductase/ring-hydroxylating ferredoxin subunit